MGAQEGPTPSAFRMMEARPDGGAVQISGHGACRMTCFTKTAAATELILVRNRGFNRRVGRAFRVDPGRMSRYEDGAKEPPVLGGIQWP